MVLLTDIDEWKSFREDGAGASLTKALIKFKKELGLEYMKDDEYSSSNGYKVLQPL